MQIDFVILGSDTGYLIKMINIITPLKKDPVFVLSFVLAAVSCFFACPRIEYIDFKVLVCLFNLMLVVKAFEEHKILDKIAIGIAGRCADSRRLSLFMIILTFFASMIVTNDISLITLVPLTIIIGRKTGTDILVTVILQTLAANIGSSLTPMGNPQNLLLFSFFNLTAPQFFSTVAPFALLGLAWLYILNLRTPETSIDFILENVQINDKGKIAIWSGLFVIAALSVFGVINYIWALLATVALTLAVNRKLFLKADYFLLITFVCFFIFIGNISSIPAVSGFVKSFLNSAKATYFSSIALSQVVSNVPCAIFLSGFTPYWRELLLGVNIGGMGTIIASLASVISYKIFIQENHGKGREYLLNFSTYNFISLAVMSLICYFIMF